MRYALDGRVGRLPSMAHGGGDGRTYSGVWPEGQAARKALLRSPLRAFGTGGRGIGKAAGSALQRNVNPPPVGNIRGEISDMALMTSKKRETRKSLSQPGWITLEGGFAARQCVVQDMSATGAKLTIDDPNSLPAKLRLAFSRDARTGRRCEVVWRRGKTVGVKFVL